MSADGAESVSASLNGSTYAITRPLYGHLEQSWRRLQRELVSSHGGAVKGAAAAAAVARPARPGPTPPLGHDEREQGGRGRSCRWIQRKGRGK